MSVGFVLYACSLIYINTFYNYGTIFFLLIAYGAYPKIKIPAFKLEDVEDYYTYYVLILEIPENIFWYADYSFVVSVAANKAAYDGWLNYVIERERGNN